MGSPIPIYAIQKIFFVLTPDGLPLNLKNLFFPGLKIKEWLEINSFFIVNKESKFNSKIRV